MNVLVVGGAGYIGSHVVNELIEQGHNVIVMDNLSTGDRYSLRKEAKFYYADVLNELDLKRVFRSEEPIDVVMYYASKHVIADSVNEPLEYYRNNIEGLMKVLSLMNQYHVKHIVYSSSASVYGNTNKLVCDEYHPTSPINPYAETKITCENMLKWMSKTNEMTYCIFRHFNIAGSDINSGIPKHTDYSKALIPEIVKHIKYNTELTIYGDDYNTKDGTCMRDFVHVTDVAKAHVLGALYLKNEGSSEIFNLGTGKGYTVKEVIDLVSEYQPVNYTITERRIGDPQALIADSTKAKQILNWKPTFNLEDIISSELQMIFERKKVHA